MRAVKVIKSNKGYYMLTLTPEIGGLIPEDMLFFPELTEDGILFRPAKSVELPTWLEKEQ